jgi:hypothetical protein
MRGASESGTRACTTCVPGDRSIEIGAPVVASTGALTIGVVSPVRRSSTSSTPS